MQVKILQSFKIFFHSCLEMLLAPVCLLCEKKRVDFHTPVCENCVSQFIRFSAFKLSLFQIELKNNGIDEPAFVGFQFNQPMQKTIHLLKYKGFSNLGIFLGMLLGKRLLEEDLVEFDIIVPVPLHTRRRKERGYNQSELIANGISLILNIPVSNSLIKRIRYTSSQALLSREERLGNLRGAFHINDKSLQNIKGKHILLVDDLITTGTTIREINKILVESGCSSILNCAVASSAD